MSALENLTDEEAYLYCILSDRGGVDQSEFLWSEAKEDDGCFRVRHYQVCLAGETGVITRAGHRAIKDLVGPVILLTRNPTGQGKWVDAEVKEFGVQQLWDIELERYGVAKTIRATAEHRWFADTGKRARRTYPEVQTQHLRPGMFLRQALPHRSAYKIAPFGVVHGLVWGDGTRDKNGGCHVNLWGEKLECSKFLHGEGVLLNRPDVNVPGRQWTLLPYNFKDPVSLKEAPSYLWSWLAGYFATDGNVGPCGQCCINSMDYQSLELVRDVCLNLGITVGTINECPVPESKPGALVQRTGDEVCYRVTLCATDLTEEFFLRTSHREAWLVQGDMVYRSREWKVVSVTETQAWEPVYCAVVPETHNFVLEGYIVTGNCWWRNRDTFQVDLSGRALGKTWGIVARAFAHLFCNPGQEMIVTAGEQVFLDPLTDKIEQRLLSCRLSRELLPMGRGAIKHRQFAVTALNGARINGRIPNADGRGVRGAHPLWLEVDESQNFPREGYVELIETLERGTPGCRWLCHGVPTSMNSWLYDITKDAIDTAPLRETPKRTAEDWTIHRLVGMLREDWNDTERQSKIMQYGGSRESPDYIRNVLGLPGPSSNNLFVTHRFMKCCDDDLSSPYNSDEYFKVEIRDGDLQRPGSDILDFLDFPRSLERYDTVWIGMDVGMVNDPSEILVFAEHHPTAAELKASQAAHKAVPMDGSSRLKLISRISMHRVKTPEQVEVILHVIDFFKPRAFSLDKTGLGLPLFQSIQDELEKAHDSLRTKQSKQALECIKGYNFSEKILVDFDQSVELASGASIDEQVKEAGIKRMVLEVSTDVLRTLVDHERLWFPWDMDLLKQWTTQTFRYAKDARDQYGRRRLFSQGDDHTVDAGRLAALGHKQFALEALINARAPETAPVLDLAITRDMMEY